VAQPKKVQCCSNSEVYESAAQVGAEEMSKHYEPIAPWIRDMRASGMALQEIVEALNEKGCVTRRGKPWNMSTLRRVIESYLGPNYLGQLNATLRPCVAEMEDNHGTA
jgi:hypothetical protein